MAEFRQRADLETEQAETKENINVNPTILLDEDNVVKIQNIPSRPKIRRGLANLICDTSTTDCEVQSSDAVYTSFSYKTQDKQAIKQKWLADNQAQLKIAQESKKPEKVTRQKIENAIVIREDSLSPPPQIPRDHQAVTEIDMEINSLFMPRQAAMEYYTAYQQTPDSYVLDYNNPAQDMSPVGNHEINIKLRWKGMIKRIPMKKTQPFQCVISDLARQNGVAESRIMLCLNDMTIALHETPKTLNLTIADIIEGYLIAEGEKVEVAEAADTIELKVQSKTSKAPKTYKIRMSEPLSDLARQYALDNNCDVDKVSFKFDGDGLDLESTPEDLELENGFCIDVKISS